MNSRTNQQINTGQTMGISRECVVDYLESAFGLEFTNLQDDTPLFSAGLLDSFSVADLLVFLEDTGNFLIEPEEIVPENLDSVGQIIAFAASKAS